MVDWTNSHFRMLMRFIAPHALLYTDMQTVGAILHQPNKALQFNMEETPLALQIGGSNKESLIQCASMAEERGFNEINLNLGCPSDRVQAGHFGVCLMAEPRQVAECIAAMKAAVSIPLTAKIRIGLDENDSYEFFSSFVRYLVAEGCDKIIVHARKAWLHGLSPKQNRSVPPLRYDFVYRIKQEYPHLPIVINGNIITLQEIKEHLLLVDGVMLGRLVCQNPYALAGIHHYYYPDTLPLTRTEILEKYFAYIQEKNSEGIPLSVLIKPLYNFAHGLARAKAWKEKLLQAQQTKDLNYLEEAFTRLREIEYA